jgi:hypothetical protein
MSASSILYVVRVLYLDTSVSGQWTDMEFQMESIHCAYPGSNQPDAAVSAADNFEPLLMADEAATHLSVNVKAACEWTVACIDTIGAQSRG